MTFINYYIRDAKEGIRRNLGASIAAVLLIFISLSMTGVLFLVKTSMDSTLDLLQSQVKVRVFVEDVKQTEEIAHILSNNNFVQSVEIERKNETMNNLKKLFKERDYLFEAFRTSSFPDTIILELKDANQAEAFAQELKDTKGIAEVIYAQEFAKTILHMSDQLQKYGVIILLVFFLSSVLTVYIAINLSLFQRQKDIRVKLLLGAKESHVRNQFLLEGSILGFFGSLLATFVIYFISYHGLYQLYQKYSAFLSFNPSSVHVVMGMTVVFGVVIGLVASYFSTRKLINHA